MKKNILTLLILFAVFSPLMASTISADSSNLLFAFELATDGDTLVLADGTYAQSIPFPANKVITLKASENAAPVISFQYDLTDAAISNGGLIFDGITINPGGDYFFRGNIGDIKILKFINCEITNIGRCFFRSDNADGYSLDSLVFDNCWIHDCGTNGWNFIYSKHIVKNFVVKNSTLNNYENGESFFYANAADTNNDFTCLFANNTVYKWAKSSDRAICNTRDQYSANSTYTFRDNIINKPGVDGQAPKIVNAFSGTLLAQNNLIVDYNGGYGSFTETINDLSLESLRMETIGFPDPDNGDFSIVSTSPLATAGTDGGPIGDPRWIKTLNQAVHVETAVSPAYAGSVVPLAGEFEQGESVIFTASSNYSYRFKEWKNKDGVAISSANPLAYTLTEDQVLTAVFDSVDTHTLIVNIEGSDWGKVSLSPEPVNGIYETGTVVTLTIEPNDVSTFLYWEDLSGEMSRQVLMDADQAVTATFDQVPFIIGWDFNANGPRGNRTADFYSSSENIGLMKLYNGDGTSTNWGGSTRTFGGVTYDCARRYTDYAVIESTPRYFEAKFSALGYDSIHVKSMIGFDNDCVHTNQKMQFSVDGATFYDLVDVNLTGKKNTEWILCEAVLPDTLTEEQKSMVYIRWIPDLSSSLIGLPNISETEGFYLANVIVFANEIIIPDNEAPQLLSSVPSEGSATASANGKIVLNFDEKVKEGAATVLLNGEELSPVFGTKTVAYEYTDLMYGASNEFVVPDGAITDLSGNPYAGITIHFATMNRPTPIKRLFDAVVAIDGTGDYTSIQDMVDAMPENRTSPWLVFVKNGYYNELVRVPSTKPYLHLIGQDRNSVTITFAINCSSGPDDSGWEYNKGSFNESQCVATEVKASNFYAENISFENEYGTKYQNGPQALAISTQNDKIAFYNCNMKSYQDTWQTSRSNGNNDRFYIYDSYVEGAVDYIYGGGNLFAERCTLYNMRSGAVIVAPSHAEGTKWGYIFSNCVIDGNELAGDGKQKLGRPWHNSPTTVYLNTTMKIPIAPEGWTDMGAYPGLFAEYNSLDGEGNLLDLSSRRTWYKVDGVTKEGFQAKLTAEQAAQYTYENVISGTDNWNPRAYFESAGQPQHLTMTSDGQLDWNDNPYAICYVIMRNGEVIGFSRESCFTDEAFVISEPADYAVKSVNEYGSLSEASDGLITNSNVVKREQGPKVYRSSETLVVENIQVGQYVQLYSIDGRLLKIKKSTNTTVRMSIEWPAGIYLVKVGQHTTKVML